MTAHSDKAVGTRHPHSSCENTDTTFPDVNFTITNIKIYPLTI